jgi:hypothetical protein
LRATRQSVWRVWPQEAVEAAKLVEAEQKKARKKKPAPSKPSKSAALTPAELGAIPWEPGEKPEMFPFLRHILRQIWKDAINDRMSGQWIGDVIQAAEQYPDQALTVTCADALQRLPDKGVQRKDLSQIAKHQVAEGICAGFHLLADPGVQENDYDDLANELLNAGPRGRDGLGCGWPLDSASYQG